MKLFTAILTFATAVAAAKTEYFCHNKRLGLNRLSRNEFNSYVEQRANAYRMIARAKQFYENNNCDSYWRFWSPRASCVETESFLIEHQQKLAKAKQQIQLWEHYCRRQLR